MEETKVKVLCEVQKPKVDPKSNTDPQIKKDIKKVEVKKIRMFRQALPL